LGVDGSLEVEMFNGETSSGNRIKNEGADEAKSDFEMGYEFIRLVIPAIISSLFVLLQESVNLIFVGQLGSAPKIAAVGIGNSIQNMLGVSVFVGMNGAINTLVS
jgi:Na+-driven multidrug efflux pump